VVRQSVCFRKEGCKRSHGPEQTVILENELQHYTRHQCTGNPLQELANNKQCPVFEMKTNNGTYGIDSERYE
jgi:hypothetical protein